MTQFYIEIPPIFQKETMQVNGKTITKRPMYINYAECLKINFNHHKSSHRPSQVDQPTYTHQLSVITPNPHKSNQSSLQKQLKE